MRDNYLSLLAGASELHQQLKLLRSLRKFGRIAKDTFTGHPQSDWLAELHETVTGTAGLQSFYYGATIVKLYGLLERFVEETLAESVRRIASMAPSYSSLPEGIRNNHLPLTLEVLGKLSTNKYQGKIDEASLVESLHSCLSQNGSFSLNDIVFAHHNANFRAEVVRQSFERIGVRMQKLESSALMKEAMSQHFPEEANPFFVIDDLAERRNEVSHGAASQLLSAEILDSYISVIESYARAVLETVTSWLILFAVPNIGIELGRPDRVFRHRIAGLSSARARITTGDVIAIIDGSGAARCSRVATIMVNDANVQTAQKGDSMGMDIGSPLTPRCRLFLMPTESEYLALDGV